MNEGTICCSFPATRRWERLAPAPSLEAVESMLWIADGEAAIESDAVLNAARVSGRNLVDSRDDWLAGSGAVAQLGVSLDRAAIVGACLEAFSLASFLPMNSEHASSTEILFSPKQLRWTQSRAASAEENNSKSGMLSKARCDNREGASCATARRWR